MGRKDRATCIMPLCKKGKNWSNQIVTRLSVFVCLAGPEMRKAVDGSLQSFLSLSFPEKQRDVCSKV